MNDADILIVKDWQELYQIYGVWNQIISSCNIADINPNLIEIITAVHTQLKCACSNTNSPLHVRHTENTAPGDLSSILIVASNIIEQCNMQDNIRFTHIRIKTFHWISVSQIKREVIHFLCNLTATSKHHQN